MYKKSLIAIAVILASVVVQAAISEINVDLKLDASSYVVGERVRVVVDVANSSPDVISVGERDSTDRLVLEVFQKSDGAQLDRATDRRFTAPFRLEHNQGQRLEAFLADNYGLTHLGSYTVRAVLIHRRTRYEGPIHSFDIVPGITLTGAMQLFKSNPKQQREFEIAKWSRAGKEHVFLKSRDVEPRERRWPTFDLGPYMKINPPIVAVQTNGEVFVIHRLDPQRFLRSEFWSLPDGMYARGKIVIRDPETAGQERVQEVFNNGKPVAPKDDSWWKFWK